MRTNPPSNICSLGYFCDITRIGLNVLNDELRRRGIKPVMVIEGIERYDVEALAQIQVDLLNAGRLPQQISWTVPSRCVEIVAAPPRRKR